MRIESGPTGERKVRTLLLLLMVAGFSGWFAYDGYIGYPAKNVEGHLSQLPTPEEREQASGSPVYASVKPEAVPKAREAIAKIGRAAQREELEKLFGGPPSFERPDAWYYFGPTFRIRIDLLEGRPARVEGSSAEKSDTDILAQKLLALVLAIVAVYCLALLAKAIRTHLVIDETGLTFAGRQPINWDQMVALDTARFAKKGWVDLVYKEQGIDRRLRLDEYHLAAFDEIIDEICARKGFENPLPVRDKRNEPAA